jgi:hypothetical protein
VIAKGDQQMVYSRTIWESEVSLLKASGADLSVITDKIQQRGRDLRPIRISTAINYLMMAAEKQHTIGYDEFSKVLLMSSHWERNQLLAHVANLCLESGWKPYVSLVIRKVDGIPGNGFYTWYNSSHSQQIPADLVARHKAVKDMHQDCFNSPLPDQQEILLKIMVYLVNHKLR